MATLLSCQPPPPPGWVTLLETDCQFLARPAAESSRHTEGGMQSPYPDLTIHTGTPHPLTSSSEHFLPVQQTSLLKRAVNSWREGHGVVRALEELVQDEDPNSEVPLSTKIAFMLLGTIRRMQGILGTISPHSQISTLDACRNYSGLHDWENSPVRAIAIHPRLQYIAVARLDDVIEIKHLVIMVVAALWDCILALLTPVLLLEQLITLKDKEQVSVMRMQWAPHCNSLLAVGTANGVLLWNIDPIAATSSTSLHRFLRVETSPGHAPISTLSWSPQGNFLVSGSPADTSLITWDIPMGVATRVRRGEGGGLALVSWSPDSQRVFAASVSSIFRVWETQSWTCDKWSCFSGRCMAACWSPHGETLLFALEGDPSLYYLSFHGNELAAGSTSAIKCADLSLCTHFAEGKEIMVGGNIQSMVWDPQGERLAIIFTSDSPGAHLVSVLRTRTSPMLEILPGGFIRGHDGELPELVAFQENRTEGALLATAWSSGRISFTPLHFQQSLSLTSFPEQLLSFAPAHQYASSGTPLYSTHNFDS